MDNIELEKVLGSMGKGCFVRYYHIYTDDTLDYRQKCAKFQRIARKRPVPAGGKDTYDIGAARNRVSNAKRIIKAEATIRALDIIEASGADEEDREQARALLKKLGAAK